MPTKPIDLNLKKNKKSSSPQVETVSTTKKNMVVSGSKRYEVPSSVPESVGLYDKERRIQQKRKTKSRVRRLLSLSIVAYLGYYSSYACGSPFDDSIEKPAICAGIDPIKLDLYALYESEFYQTNLDPYIHPVATKATEVYYTHGIPASIKAQELYFSHGKPRLEQTYIQAQQIYQKHVIPLYNQNVAPYVNPYLAKAQPYIDQVEPIYTNQVKPAFQQATTKAYVAKHFVLNYNLPPSLKQYKDSTQEKVMYWIDRAENTEVIPILVRLYWATLDFYQDEFLPVLNRSHVVTRIKLYYKEHVKSFVDEHIVPVLVEINHRVHLDRVVHHLLSFLPQERSLQVEEVVYTASSINTQTKTGEEDVTSTTNDIPTTPATVVSEEKKKVTKTVTVVSKKSSAASIVTVVESTSSTIMPVPASASTSVVTSTSVSSAAAASPEATIGYQVTNDDDIKTHQESKSTPSATTPQQGIEEEVQEEIELVEQQDVVPNADKKEAIYCPTCNSAEEQMIVAPTDKNLAAANTEKHLHALPTEKELFEVHTEQAQPAPPAQPTSPNTESYEDVEQIVIQAPIPREPVLKEEEKQSDVTKEEDIVFSILPVKSEEEEEEVFTIQTSAPTPSAVPESKEEAIVIESVEEDKLVEEDIENINEAIVQEIKDEEKEQVKEEQVKEEQKIFVPPAIKNKELVLESEKEHFKSAEQEEQEPVFIKVEEPVKEPITTHIEEPVVIVENKEKEEKEEEEHPEIKIRAPFAAASVITEPVESPITE